MMEIIKKIPHEREPKELEIDLAPVVEATALLAKALAESGLDFEAVGERLSRHFDVQASNDFLQISFNSSSAGLEVFFNLTRRLVIRFKSDFRYAVPGPSLELAGVYDSADILFMLGCSYCRAESLFLVGRQAASLGVGAEAPPVVGVYEVHLEHDDKEALEREAESLVDAALELVHALGGGPAPVIGDLVRASIVEPWEWSRLPAGARPVSGEVISDLYVGNAQTSRQAIVRHGFPSRLAFVEPATVTESSIVPLSSTMVVNIPDLVSEPPSPSLESRFVHYHYPRLSRLEVRGEFLAMTAQATGPVGSALRLDVQPPELAGQIGVSEGELEIALRCPDVLPQALRRRHGKEDIMEAVVDELLLLLSEYLGYAANVL